MSLTVSQIKVEMAFFNQNLIPKKIYILTFTEKLEEANTLLKLNQTLTDEQLALDPLYGRNLGPQSSATTVNYWRKFGNSLYLRLLLRASGAVESNAIAKVAEIYKYQ